MNTLIKIFCLILPWRLKRIVLRKYFGYRIHSNAYIGIAWIFPKRLTMEEGARIDHFNVAIHLEFIQMGKHSIIGRSNWITGFPIQKDSQHFCHQQNRRAELILGEHSAITKHHHFDCTNLIEIGCFATIAGYSSQFLTHSVDLVENRQDSFPIYIGDYTFVGTNVVILGGSKLPSFSVLAPKSVLKTSFDVTWRLYGGAPAKICKTISSDAKYFSRKVGVVF